MIRSVGWLTLSALYVGLVSTLLVFVLGRWLGPQGFGEYSAVLSIVSILAIAMDGGFRNLIQREFAARSLCLERDQDSLLPTAVGYTLLTTVVLGLAVLALPYRQGATLAWAIVAMGAMTLVQFWGARLRGQGAFAEDARWQAMQRTSTAGLAAAMVIAWPYAWIAFAGWCAGAWLALLGSRARVLLAKIAVPHPRLMHWWRACAPFLVIDLATAIYFRIDVVMIDWLTGDAEAAGVYSAAYRLLEVVIFLFNPLAIVLFRQLRLVSQHRADFRKLIGLTLLASVVLAALIWIGTWCLGDAVVNLAYGKAFAPAAALLPWLMASVLFVLPNGVLSQGAIALNLEWGYARVGILAAVTNVGLNGWLIPLHGPYGAAMATIVTEAVLFIGLMRIMRAWLVKE